MKPAKRVKPRTEKPSRTELRPCEFPVYVKIREGVFYENRELYGHEGQYFCEVVGDFDKDGNLLGVEILK